VDVHRGVQSVFRAANERLRSRLAGHTGTRPVICECSDQSCMAVLNLTVEDYEQVRGAGHFVVAGGHADLEIERIVADRDGYVIVDKY
jgi:hypothetical protein